MQHRVGITPARLTFASPAGASSGWEIRGSQPRFQYAGSAVHERRTAETTGSLADILTCPPVVQDGQGRDLRSASRRTAKFLERPFIDRNLGVPTDGPAL